MSFRKISLIVVLCLLVGHIESQPLKILTCNIRLDTPDDGPNAWPIRKAWLCNQIKAANPGIFGIQEGLPHQVKYIDSVFSEFRHIGVGREDGKVNGEFSAIWYNIKFFRLIRHGTFWLSSTPQIPSLGWDAACKRVCTYGLFRNISSGQQFWVFNTHFDHMGEQARKNSALLVLQKIDTLNKSGLPVILTGDFNDIPESVPVKIILGKLQDSRISDRSISMGPGGTFNGFDLTKSPRERIDYIFTGYGARAATYHIIIEQRDGRYSSDHFPVVAEINFK